MGEHVSEYTRVYIHRNALIFMPLMKNIFNIEHCEDLMR